jgi:hypothetical protein
MSRVIVRPALLVAFALAGCGPSEAKLPPLTEVEGVVLLGGQPLPHATVTFNPTQGGLPPNSAATGLTDAKGHFKLAIGGKSGAVPGENIVTVTEGPVPEDARDQEAQAKLAAFQAGLPNRPIPNKYGNTNTSNVRITVTKDQKEYKVELSR